VNFTALLDREDGKSEKVGDFELVGENEPGVEKNGR
jgi:hypothetical protein